MDVRATQIYDLICQYPGLTERELASRVGLKKTPYTRWILFSLIEHGHILRTWDESRYPHAYVYYAQKTMPLEMKE